MLYLWITKAARNSNFFMIEIIKFCLSYDFHYFKISPIIQWLSDRNCFQIIG